MPTTYYVTGPTTRRQQSIGLILLLLVAFDAPVAPAQEKPIPLPGVTVEAPYGRPAVPSSATTGTKTDTPLKDIPASIQVVPKEVLADQGAYSLDAVTRNVSGVAQSSSSNYGFFNNYLIRGLNQKFLRDGLIDGPQINGYARTLTDVERIEVLKGPGSALYGSGEPGGIVNLISKQPLEKPLYSLYGSGGSFGTHREAVDLGGPLGVKHLLYRFNGAYYHSDGFRDLSNTTIEILPLLTWKPNPDHTLTLKFDYRNIEAIADTLGIPFRGRTLLGVPRETKYYTPFSDTDQELYRGALNYELKLTDALLLRNNFAILRQDLFLRRNSGGTVGPGRLVMTGRRLREETIFRTDYVYQLEPVWTVMTGTTKHKFVAGFEYQLQLLDAKRAEANLPNITDVFHPVIPEVRRADLVFRPSFDRHIEANQYGLYAQDQIGFTEQWKVRMGLRADRFESKDFNRLSRPRKSRSDDELGGQAGLVYQPVKATSFFGGVSRSHLSTVSNEGAARAPEKATQWELGNKTTFLDDQISLNLALFHVTREDFLVTIGTDQVPIGEQRTQGFELDLASEPVPGWKLYANYAYQDAELTKLSPTDPSSGKGHRPTGVPIHSAGLWTTYELQSGALKGLGFGAGLTYKASVFLDTLNTQAIPAYVVGDLVAFYRWGSFEVQMNVNNVADTTYFRNGSNIGGLPGEPLAVLGSVQVRY